jgi:tetratricopeptide (TPR) repeat protein
MQSFLRITSFLLFFTACVFGDFYHPDRSAFPALCETHFDNNLVTTSTWLEAEDKATLLPFRFFLNLIPKPYEADCYGCPTCGGVHILLFYQHWDWPTDEYPNEEINTAHTYTRKPTYYNGYDCTSEGSYDCEAMSWDGGYFRKWNHKYLHFFQHYLQYCHENKVCSCFWPETSSWAVHINDSVYKLLRDFAEENFIDVDFSQYWTANKIEFDYEYRNVQRIKGEEYYPNSHGMASSLTTYTFFYSQYHQMLLDVASYIDMNAIHGPGRAINRTYQMLESIRDDFFNLYDECLAKHPHPKIYYERGLLKMHSGDALGAIADMSFMMALAQNPFKGKIDITSEMYHQEGQVYADLGMYDQAIEALNEAIKLDPKNKRVYFDRAGAYFEKGDFDQALSDYLISDRTSFLSNPKIKTSIEFEQGLLKGVIEGGKDAAIEFIPSLCHTAYGMGATLWACTSNPGKFVTYLVNPCHEIAQTTLENLKKLDKEQLEECCDELKELYSSFNKLHPSEKGEKIGYVVGKYGFDIFAGGFALKGVAALRKLKQVNQMCNLEAMAVSAVDKEIVVAQALKHASEREAYFKNVKYNFHDHYKHVPGHHQYEAGRSIWEHKDPEGLLKRFAGTGHPETRFAPGEPGYKETVDFKEHIGICILPKRGINSPTTRGTIHYGKKGAHIIPADPNPQIRNPE